MVATTSGLSSSYSSLRAASSGRASSNAAVTRAPRPPVPRWVETMMASSPISWRAISMASAMVGAV